MNKLTYYKNSLCYTENLTGAVTLEDADILRAFAESLLELRKHCGLSLVGLSRETDIPNQTLSSYENRTRMPSMMQAIKIAAYFGLTVEDFILCGLDYSPYDITELYEARKNG